MHRVWCLAAAAVRLNKPHDFLAPGFASQSLLDDQSLVQLPARLQHATERTRCPMRLMLTKPLLAAVVQSQSAGAGVGGITCSCIS